LGQGCAEDGGQHLLWVGVAETAFVGASEGRAEGREEDDVIGVFLQDVFQSFLELSHHGGRCGNARLEGDSVYQYMIKRYSMDRAKDGDVHVFREVPRDVEQRAGRLNCRRKVTFGGFF